MFTIEDFQIYLNDKEILRLLRGGNSTKARNKEAPQGLLDEIKEMKEIAIDLIKPRGIYNIFNSRNLVPRFLFEKSERTVLAVCTIGDNLEKKCSEFIKRGKLSNGVILDAIASHAAEETAEYVNQAILKELSEEIKEKDITCRFSPGYCQWTLEKGQYLIFKLLSAESIGVELSSSMMMNPIKSVSFAFNIGEEVDKELGTRGCEDCDLINCAYRRDK